MKEIYIYTYLFHLICLNCLFITLIAILSYRVDRSTTSKYAFEASTVWWLFGEHSTYIYTIAVSRAQRVKVAERRDLTGALSGSAFAFRCSLFARVCEETESVKWTNNAFAKSIKLLCRFNYHNTFVSPCDTVLNKIYIFHYAAHYHTMLCSNLNIFDTIPN